MVHAAHRATEEDKKALIQNHDCFIFDCDGKPFYHSRYLCHVNAPERRCWRLYAGTDSSVRSHAHLVYLLRTRLMDLSKRIGKCASQRRHPI